MLVTSGAATPTSGCEGREASLGAPCESSGLASASSFGRSLVRVEPSVLFGTGRRLTADLVRRLPVGEEQRLGFLLVVCLTLPRGVGV